jgi:hypothetical protein
MLADHISFFASLVADCSETDKDVPNIDSIDMSSVLLGDSYGVNSAAPRTVVPLSSRAIIVEDEDGIDWKLVLNSTFYLGTDTGFWTPEVWPSTEFFFPHSPYPSVAPLNASAGYLFNLNDDPFERNDLALAFPEKAQELRGILDGYRAGAFQTGSDDYQDPRYVNCVSLIEKIDETGGWAAPVCT